MAAAQRPPVVSESVGAAPSSGSSFPYPFNPYGSAAAAVAAPAAPAPAAAAVPVSSYEAMLAKTNAELGLQKPVKPPPGAPQKDLDAYYDALGEWEFNQQARQLQLSTEETAKVCGAAVGFCPGPLLLRSLTLMCYIVHCSSWSISMCISLYFAAGEGAAQQAGEGHDCPRLHRAVGLLPVVHPAKRGPPSAAVQMAGRRSGVL